MLQPTKAETPTYLGTSTDKVRLHFFKSEKLKIVRVWVNEAGKVILVDADYPPATPEQYFQTLGEPDAHLDVHWGRGEIPGGEHVWLQRGATIVSKPEWTKGVAHVGIFPAGLTLDVYQASHRYMKIIDDDEG